MLHLLIVCLVSTVIHCAVSSLIAILITLMSKRHIRIVHGYGPTIFERRIRTANLCVKLIPLSNSMEVIESNPNHDESGTDIPDRPPMAVRDWLMLGICPFSNFVLSVCAANYSASYDVSIFVCYGLYVVLSYLMQSIYQLYPSQFRDDESEDQAVKLTSFKGFMILLIIGLIWAIYFVWLIGSINQAEWIQTTANLLRFKAG